MLTFTTPFTAFAVLMITLWSAAATKPCGAVVSRTV